MRQWLRKIREDQGLTLEDVAQRASKPGMTVRPGILGDLERCECYCHPAFAKAIGEALGLTPEQYKPLGKEVKVNLRGDDWGEFVVAPAPKEKKPKKERVKRPQTPEEAMTRRERNRKAALAAFDEQLKRGDRHILDIDEMLAALKESGVSQEEASGAIGRSKGWMATVLTTYKKKGRATIDSESLMALANALKVRPERITKPYKEESA